MTDQTPVRRKRRARSHSRAESQNVTTVTRELPTLSVLLVAIGLAITGGRMALAGLASYQAEAFIESWEHEAQEPSARAWRIAEGAAQRAITLYPVANGEYADRLGLVFSWQQYRQPYGAAAAQASRRAALNAYREATTARPTWPDSWVRLAHAKLYLLEFDAEFHQAMKNAAELGPWRIGINRELAEIGFTAWPQLNQPQRQATLKAAHRTVAYSNSEAKNYYNIAQHTGLSKLLCTSLDDQLKAARKICPLTHLESGAW
ncbi:hypothetical protein [Stutzerimonas azotifigens]|uniref:hypothetical protein n=1 Tax=Stutzerimonas azotifigens TaxID=291995 RepID=UPI0012688740|nr:hypothetical protein [Stutzerimonas azotifigens]